MKSIILLLALAAPISSFAEMYLDIVSCSGKFQNGVEMKVSVFASEATICGKSDKAIMSISSTTVGQNLADVTISENAGTKMTEAKFEIKYPEEGSYSNILSFSRRGKVGTYIETTAAPDGTDVESEKVDLVCNPIRYEMDCSNVK